VNDILSEADIDRLCKPIKQRAAQARRLSALLGFQVKRRPDGLPIITQRMLERLEGNTRPAQNDAGINWSKRA
jgi:hypothetical protein